MPDDISILVGKKIQDIRQLYGISLEELASDLDISVKQLHKYETAGNRLTVSQLCKIAQALDMPAMCFLPEFVETEASPYAASVPSNPQGALYKETILISALLASIQDQALKDTLINLMQKIAEIATSKPPHNPC